MLVEVLVYEKVVEVLVFSGDFRGWKNWGLKTVGIFAMCYKAVSFFFTVKLIHRRKKMKEVGVIILKILIPFYSKTSDLHRCKINFDEDIATE